MQINLTDEEVELVRRALSFWWQSEETIPAKDGGVTAKKMMALQARVERVRERSQC